MPEFTNPFFSARQDGCVFAFLHLLTPSAERSAERIGGREGERESRRGEGGERERVEGRETETGCKWLGLKEETHTHTHTHTHAHTHARTHARTHTATEASQIKIPPSSNNFPLRPSTTRVYFRRGQHG